MTLIQMAIAFVINHPAVTPRSSARARSSSSSRSSAPRRSSLDAVVLDRIDEIVPPGTTLAAADTGYQNPGLRPEARRR